MKNVVFTFFCSLFVVAFTNVSLAHEASSLITPSDFSNKLAQERANNLRMFLGDDSIDLAFDDTRRELTVFWDNPYELSISELVLANFESIEDCAVAKEKSESLLGRSGFVHQFCNVAGDGVNLIGVEIFRKETSSVKIRKDSIDFVNFSECMESSAVKSPLRVFKADCTITAICTKNDQFYVPVFFDKVYCK